jgi:hypothetical protein
MEKLDDEKVIVYPSHLTCETVVLQPDAGVSFIIVLDDVARRLETLWEASVVHSASEHFWPWLLKVVVVSFMIITTFVVWVPRMALVLCIVVLQAVLMMHLGF